MLLSNKDYCCNKPIIRNENFILNLVVPQNTRKSTKENILSKAVIKKHIAGYIESILGTVLIVLKKKVQMFWSITSE